MVEEQDVDMTCVGEGEYAFMAYLAALEKGEEPTAISNLWIKHPDGTIDSGGNRFRPRSVSCCIVLITGRFVNHFFDEIVQLPAP